METCRVFVKTLIEKKKVQREFLEVLDVGVRKLSGGVCNGLFTVDLGTSVGVM